MGTDRGSLARESQRRLAEEEHEQERLASLLRELESVALDFAHEPEQIGYYLAERVRLRPGDRSRLEERLYSIGGMPMVARAFAAAGFIAAPDALPARATTEDWLGGRVRDVYDPGRGAAIAAAIRADWGIPKPERDGSATAPTAAQPSATPVASPTVADAAVQFAGRPNTNDPRLDEEEARRGFTGIARRLPHRKRIQESFGRHTIDDVEVHVDAASEAAADRLGAEAYTMGDKVAFKRQPELHTAAHEAAHVVQQRAGVAGRPGDQLERHADEVADKVVRGESAEALLDRVAVPPPREGSWADVHGRKRRSLAADALAEWREAAASAEARQDRRASAGRTQDEARPDVVTVAHEASPVIRRPQDGRQSRPRQGLHADRVAENVVRVESFEAPLASVPRDLHPGLEHKADGMGARAGALNKLADRAKPALTSGLTLQRCKKKSTRGVAKSATAALPTPKADTKKLTNGEMTWSLKATSQTKVKWKVDFKPDTSKVKAKNVSFVQTVVNTVGKDIFYSGTSANDPVGDKAEYEIFNEPKENRRVDHIAGTEDDPFYGAEWDDSAKKWKSESSSWKVADQGATSNSAYVTDGPGASFARHGYGDLQKSFETVPTVLETGQQLGSIKWGFAIKDKADSPVELLHATKADCVDTPSKAVDSALTKFYDAKFEEILDEFPSGDHKLTAAHKTQLDSVATRLKANAALKCSLGGAADLKESNPQTVAKKRADAAEAYLTAKGVTNTITVLSYGSDWARVKATTGADEPKNRRVQIWVRP